MPRKATDRVPINVRLRPELKDRLEAIGEARCIGRNLIVEVAIERFLDALEADPLTPEAHHD